MNALLANNTDLARCLASDLSDDLVSAKLPAPTRASGRPSPRASTTGRLLIKLKE